LEEQIASLRSLVDSQSDALSVSTKQFAALSETAKQSLLVARGLAQEASSLARQPLRALLGKAVGRKNPGRFLDTVKALEPLVARHIEVPQPLIAPDREIPAKKRRKASAETSEIAAPSKLLYVSHDAHPHGAQMLSLAIVRTLTQQLGLDVEVVLLDDGPLIDRFEALAPIHLLKDEKPDGEQAIALAQKLYAKGFRGAIANTVVSGHFVKTLSENGFRVVSLVHELAGVIRTGQFETHAKAIAENADRVVFAAEIVRASFETFGRLSAKQAIIRPQGLYKSPAPSDPVETHALRAELRERLGLAPTTSIVINVGFGDHRKGIDLFCETARRVISQRNDIAFLWVGKLHAELEKQVHLLANKDELDGRLKMMGLLDPSEVGRIYGGADIFALTSREDPFPSVVLEALDAGLPVVGFDGVTGTSELIGRGPGAVVAPFDVDAMAEAIVDIVDRHESRANLRAKTHTLLADGYDFRRYVLDLVALAEPRYRRVSVIVPSRNDREELESRLRRIARQTYPIYEVIVTGHAATWVEPALLNEVPGVRFVTAEGQSCSLIAGWRTGIESARGDYVWIDGADDFAEPQFVETLLKGFESPGVVMSYCQSRRIDESGTVLAADWLADVADISKVRWSSAYVAEGADEIAST
jgi:glycosyltransferase involved in cell wall biosynthesis